VEIKEQCSQKYSREPEVNKLVLRNSEAALLSGIKTAVTKNEYFLMT
jgi:hypothetical protein